MSTSKTLGLRRISALIALLGMMILSSGVALLMAATPANASTVQRDRCDDDNKTSASAAPSKHDDCDDQGEDCDDQGDDNDRTVAKSHDDQGDDCDDNGDDCDNGRERTIAKSRGDDDCDDNGDDCDNGRERTIANSRGDDDCDEGDDCNDPRRTTAKSHDDDCGHEGDDCDDQPQAPKVSAKQHDHDDCDGDDDGDDCGPVIILKSNGKHEDDDDNCVAPYPTVTYTEPSCVGGNDVSYLGSGDHSTFALTAGTLLPNNLVTVTATADPGWEYPNGQTTKEFEHEFDPAVNLEGPPCVIVEGPTETVPTDPAFIDPTCDSDDTQVILPIEAVEIPSRHAAGPVVQTADAFGVHYEVTGDIAPGGSVEIDATALPGFVIAEGAPIHWEHTFPALEECVLPPIADPAVVVTPTLVEAGLGSTIAQADPRTEQGRVLLAVGMSLLLVAGALGATPAVARRRAS